MSVTTKPRRPARSSSGARAEAGARSGCTTRSIPDRMFSAAAQRAAGVMPPISWTPRAIKRSACASGVGRSVSTTVTGRTSERAGSMREINAFPTVGVPCRAGRARRSRTSVGAATTRRGSEQYRPSRRGHVARRRESGSVPRGDGRLTHDLDPSAPGPQDACGVFGVWAPGEEVAKLTYFGLYALQHRGQEAAGIAVSDGASVVVYKDLGLVRQVFDEPTLGSLRGHIAVGHTRYSSTGASTWENAQPPFRTTEAGTGL